LSGIFLLATKGESITPHIGDLLILGACAAWSLGNVLVKKMLKYTPVSADVISFFRPVAGLPLLLVFILLAPLYPLHINQIFLVNYFDLHYIIFSMLSGILTGLYFIYMNRTLKFASASYVAMMSALTPVLVTLLAVIFLKEAFSLIQLIGITLIIAAGMITHYLKTDQH
jgi:drug/metabolite transporter (DMT)-like permease